MMKSINVTELQLLHTFLSKLRRTLSTGWYRINWNSLAIEYYIEDCNKALEQFSTYLNAIYELYDDVDERMSEIESMNLLDFPSKADYNNVLPTGKQFFNHLTNQRAILSKKAAYIHKGVTSSIIKLEGIIFATNTGCCKQMVPIYTHLEQKIFERIYSFTVNNLKKYYKALDGCNTPMFSVDLLLSGHEVTSVPQISEISKYATQDIRDLVEFSRSFIRWKRGSCLPTQPVKIGVLATELYHFNFATDISLSQEILILGQQILSKYVLNLEKLKAVQDHWRKNKYLFYSAKHAQAEKWYNASHLERSPIDVHEKMLEYTQKRDDLCKPANEVVSHGFLQIRQQQLYLDINVHIRKWELAYCQHLYESFHHKIKKLNEDFEIHTKAINTKPDSLEQLINLLKAIQNVNLSGLSIEFRTMLIQEQGRILELHNYQLDENDIKSLNNLPIIWNDIKNISHKKGRKVVGIKSRFRDITKQQIGDFRERVIAFAEKFAEEGPHVVGPDLDLGLVRMKYFREELRKFEDQRQEYANSEKLFDLPISLYNNLHEIGTKLTQFDPIYTTFESQKKMREEWSETLWRDLNITVLQEGIELELKKFRKLPKTTRQLPIGQRLEETMKEFKESLPLFVDLKHEALRERHWKELMKRTGQTFEMDPDTFTLASIFAMQLHRFRDVIGEIVTFAVKESGIEKGIKEVEQTWSSIKFQVNVYTKGTQNRGFVLGALDEILQTLDDNAMNLQSMGASKFIGPFLGTVQNWEKVLSTISEVLDIWVVVQRKWIYLESIFVGGDIRSQLPEEAAKFDKIDKAFKKIMEDAHRSPLVKQCCMVPNRHSELENLSDGLERCQKSLNDYLDTKRNAFPRFFFISDDELLSILGSSEVECVQEHMIKMFDNIAKLNFVKGSNLENSVTAMISSEQEKMDYDQPVSATGRVEEWMTRVEEEMKRSNRLLCKKAVFYYRDKKSRVDWMFDFQGMMVLVANQIWWTWEIEDVFRKLANGHKTALKDYAKMLHEQLNQIVYKVRTPLEDNDRAKLTTVLIIDVHARDIVDGFVRDSITNAKEFDWESQLRFYWERLPDELVIRQCTGKFFFGYEYMGLNGRLVITPLTDRIYLTLTQALSMYLGGAPAGPAGTGKTETTKDLAKALGLLCVVTNCGEGMDNQAVGKIFSGLCQVGAWGCFDEFNRIEASVLSVISTQLRTIQTALINKLKRFKFEGLEIKLDPRVGMFITMNPGYAGRTELPESVKTLFRPVVVIVPDLQQICEIMLFSQGFLTAKVLSKKMTTLYKLSREQLSKQFHYDFGLRALKSVLVMAGDLMRADPELSEEMVLMRALRDMNLPKFIFEDVPLFLALIQDLFPGMDCPRVRYPNFNDAVEQSLQDHHYIALSDQADKVVQLYETMKTRHTSMVVGPTGGGKTVVINTLCEAQTKLGLVTKLHTINPKDRSVIELYGVLDPDSRDWTDGLLSNIFREINKPTDKKEKRYIVFDGDVDALWVENMNSVMDDNKLLTLANGERIRLQAHCALLFEVGDLQYASPATVSRCGMVYVDPKYLGYEPYWLTWLNTMPRSNKQEKAELARLYEKYIPKTVARIIDGMDGENVVGRLKSIVPLTNLNLVTQFCYLLETLMQGLDPSPDFTHLEAVFIQAMYFGLGGALLDDAQEKFDAFVKYNSSLPAVATKDTSLQRTKASEIPTAQPMWYDYFYDIKKAQWVAWIDLVPEYQHDRNKSFTQILVPTMETVRVTSIVDLMVACNRPILLVGETGTSKTAICQSFLRDLDQDKYLVLPMNFSSRTTSLDVQRNLEANVEKRGKDTYGPVSGKKLLIFIDDLNMPQVDTYGTQQPITLLKLVIERHGLYDRGKDLNWKRMQDMKYLGAMGKPGGGRNDVDPRFVSLFTVFNVIRPSEKTLFKIYNSIISGHCAEFEPGIQEILPKITEMTLNLYKFIVQQLPPTPSKFHYIFNMRDLSRIYGGLCNMVVDKFTLPEHIIRLWRHEVSRVIMDRLINLDDKVLVHVRLLLCITF
ncbi:Dynein heavy chain 10, axonemal [Cichlidogyrus casuarinus]|uniref:Dynein heavy chain 10, axonemal n=1 Tax=Cichlidogyrus casuarinus TaxID=1844966 RepID=A0ABD2QDG3_9PLAT